ncbi:hypothetical protein GOQ30_13450 [Flavobacterium sp. TP390]|uniref:DUF4595 domain-containing protein n=1 Tax=Flavobacterium profundi TaxID=1774945 RepID=A0A6I4ITG0_9FLAO|nr:hypothetical protein [Flavobacterium profundi]MVO10172.1 hypothetical protein [Flavobacterium profundi]
MKKLILILALAMFSFSCSKDDEPTPQPLLKVIDKIEVKTTNPFTFPLIFTYELRFEYNLNKEISKISYYYSNGDLNASFAYTYQNNIPVSAIYNQPENGDPASVVNYGYNNGIFNSVNYTYYYSAPEFFTYNSSTKQYSSTGGNNNFIVNETNDIEIKNRNGSEYAFSFDTSKKGPLYNVINKKWIPVLWYISGLESTNYNVTTTYPVVSMFDDNLAQTNPFTNTYDTDGFVVKSFFTSANGVASSEITYSYKSI